MGAGTLYIVATPIGNMQDVSLRCVKTLFSVDAIACEDTRRAGLLLKNIESTLPITQYTNNPINTPKKPKLISYYEQNELQRIPEIIAALKDGLNIALMSDAGTPLISDPGFKLVRSCVENGIQVEAIPGPSSVITALSVSCLPTDKFLFLGYLSKKQGKKTNQFATLKQLLAVSKDIQPTVILFESPFRVIATLKSLQEVFGDIYVIVARELTKLHEEVRREDISESVAHFEKTKPKGEFVILFHLDTNSKKA